MRIIKIDISHIIFQHKEYTQELYDSIIRIGLSFPIHVNFINNQYECIDGHKRLSALEDILNDNPRYSRGRDVCIIVKNNMNNRSNDCWNGRNTH